MVKLVLRAILVAYGVWPRAHQDVDSALVNSLISMMCAGKRSSVSYTEVLHNEFWPDEKSIDPFTKAFSTSEFSDLSVLFARHSSQINSGWGHFSLGVKYLKLGWHKTSMTQSSISVYLSTSITDRHWTISSCLGVVCPQFMVYTCCPLLYFT